MQKGYEVTTSILSSYYVLFTVQALKRFSFDKVKGKYGLLLIRLLFFSVFNIPALVNNMGENHFAFQRYNPSERSTAHIDVGANATMLNIK